jgi:hypothetical protein
MRELTTKELFKKGIDFLNNKELEKAETIFLNVMYSSSIESDNYQYLLGAVDKLALYIYTNEDPNYKDRGLRFFQTFYKDRNVSLGYAIALLNDIYESNNYQEVLHYLSNAYSDDIAYLYGIMYNDGLGLKKDLQKAKILFSSRFIAYKFRDDALKFMNGIDLNLDLNQEEINTEANKIIQELFLEEYNFNNEFDLELLNKEFFENSENLPIIDKYTDKPNLINNQIHNESQYQITTLENLFSSASHSIIFKRNPKYCINKFEGLIPYIAYNDVMGDLYIIRGKSANNFDSFHNGKEDVIIEYYSLETLVEDGWRLD